MWRKDLLYVPWSSSRETSPVGERQIVGEPASATSLPVGVSTTEGLTGLCERRHVYTHHDAISAVRLLDDNIVIGGVDGTVRQCKLEVGGGHATEVVELFRSKERMAMQAISKDGRWIVLVVHDGRRVAVWDAITRQRSIESIGAHEQIITALDISLDASKIASGSRDGKVMVWCMETGQPFAGPFQLPQGTSVLSVRFSPHGDRLACIEWRSIHVWNVCSGDKESIIPTDPAYSLAWSNDGRRVFAGSSRGSIMCFNLSALTPVMPEWRGNPHFDVISTLCLSNNGKFIISASRSEYCIKIWDVHTHSQLGSLEHPSAVLHAEVSPDDGHLVSATQDGKFYLWDIRKVLGAPYCFRSQTMSTSRSDSHLILTEISNAAYISWRTAELTRAEQILSSEIGCNSLDLLCYHLANRALVRARLRQWDGAFDDAQSSFLLKPSLVARLAMSITLAGHKKYSAALETLDLALENCDQAENNFVSVIKAITFFNAGSHDEAIRRMDNPVVIGSPDVERPFAFVQGKMYASLAADAMNAREHNKAISLFMQARDCCPAGQCPEMDTISLITGWVFDGLRLSIYRQLCEVCHAAGHTHQILDTLQQLESNFKDEIKLRRELHGWLISFKLRCTEMLESQGDLAMHNKDYHSAVAQYSAALDTHPTVLQTSILVKRSEARAALCLWTDALRDADEAVRLDPSAPWSYQRRHAALHRLERYEDAIEARKAMISILENSPDPRIRQLRANYVDPSDTTKAILDAATVCIRNSPFRLIDTSSGLLCDAEERKNVFKEDPIFQEMVSSMTSQLHQERIDMATKYFFQYVMLSHRWEAPELELADVWGKSIYDLDVSPSATKLQRFCYLARDAKIRWAWSDACCINKDKDEFEKSINLMFQWYYDSAATIVHLAGVLPLLIRGGLKGSVWMTRGWTLQELLAPRIIRFYYDDWTPYLNNMSLNHKESADIMQELEDATGVTVNDLLDFRPGLENIAVKLRLASTRETTEPVDMAYGLFGIFGVKMPVIRGESQQHALGRLFQEIVARSGDVACLAWVGRPSEFNSTFPHHLRVYEHPSRTIPHIGEEDMERRVVELRRAWSREEEAQAVSFYQGLNKLPAACCTNQHVRLPCIVFPVMALGRIKQTEHRATTKALEDTEIYSGAELLHWAQDLVLVCPWIDELLDAVPGRYEETRSDSDPEPLPGSGASNSGRMDTALKASRLAVRFRQPLGALLLRALGRERYRRVAPDNEIIIRVRDEVSLETMSLQMLQIM